MHVDWRSLSDGDRNFQVWTSSWPEFSLEQEINGSEASPCCGHKPLSPAVSRFLPVGPFGSSEEFGEIAVTGWLTWQRRFLESPRPEPRWMRSEPWCLHGYRWEVRKKSVFQSGFVLLICHEWSQCVEFILRCRFLLPAETPQQLLRLQRTGWCYFGIQVHQLMLHVIQKYA